MGLKATDKGGSTFEPLPAGVHVAVCDQVVDLGMQSSNFGTRRQCYLRWQVPDERVTWERDGAQHEGPAVVGKFFTVSLHPMSNLRPFLEAWRGKPFTSQELEGFDLFHLLGAPCQLSVIHETDGQGKVRAKISAIMALPRGATRPQVEGDPVAYSTDGDCTVAGVVRPADEVLATLPEWLQNTIGQRVVQPGKQTQAQPAAQQQGTLDSSMEDDDPPF